MKTIITGITQITQHIIPTLSGERKNTFTALVVCIMFILPSLWEGSGMGLRANNLSITNVAYAATPSITFDITWDNSWWSVGSGTNNYDGVWIFIKQQSCQYPASATTPVPAWTHAGVTTVSANHVVNSSNLPIIIDAVADGKGVFIHQTSSQLSGTVSANVTLRLSAAAANYNWKVFGIEVVYIPTIAYSAGDGSGTTTNPFNNAGAAINIGAETSLAAGALYAASPVVPAAFPKGYNNFYCMKQEISQAQYKNFLNTLSYDQQVSRTTQSPDAATAFLWALTLPGPSAPYNRNGVKMASNTGLGPGNGIYNYLPAVYGCDFNNNNTVNENGDGLDAACNYLSWADVAAFLDWAALRPMTEMEYEKVCRGTVASLADEYPWGSTNLTAAISTAPNLNNPGTVGEASTLRPAAGLCVYNNATATEGPIRGGASTTSSTTRDQAAAAYYGPLDMGGNVWEQVVSVENGSGATNLFTGVLGDGALTAAGDANQANWPSVVTGAGSGARGGSWYTTAANQKYLRTSDRTNATTPTTTRNMEYGGRGVR